MKKFFFFNCVIISIILSFWYPLYIGYGWFAYVSWLLFCEFGKTVPFIPATLVLCGFQWIIAPEVVYGMPNGLSSMMIDEGYYMSIVVPAYVCFCFGALVVKRNGKMSDLISREKIDFIIFLLAVVILGKFLQKIPGLQTVGILLEYLLMCAVVYSFFTPYRILSIGLALYQIISKIVISLENGMFHELLLLGFWLGAFFLYRIKASRLTVVVFLAVSISTISICQFVKTTYRSQVTEDVVSNAEMFYTLAEEKIRNQHVSSYDEDFWIRFNEGWHIAHVIFYMDRTGDYKYGETILDTFSAILLPRFLASNKRNTGGRENMETMTFHNLQKTTSMNISYVGEGYGNFGKTGCWIFMVCVGMVLSGLENLIYKLHKKYGFFIFFMPTILFFCIRAESDLLTAFSWAFRMFLVAAVIIYLYRSYEKNGKKVTLIPGFLSRKNPKKCPGSDPEKYSQREN